MKQAQDQQSDKHGLKEEYIFGFTSCVHGLLNHSSIQ
jgi:hypothetical protein